MEEHVKKKRKSRPYVRPAALVERQERAAALVRGGMSMSQAAKESGMGESSVRRACRHHGVVTLWQETNTGKRWCKGYKACLGCGTTKRRMAAHGMCARCYTRHRRKTDPAFVAYERAYYAKVRKEKPPPKRSGPKRTAECQRRHRALAKAEGYDPRVKVGSFVTAAYLKGWWRVTRRYVMDNECVCDLAGPSSVLKEAPVQSLRVFSLAEDGRCRYDGLLTGRGML